MHQEKIFVTEILFSLLNHPSKSTGPLVMAVKILMVYLPTYLLRSYLGVNAQ